MSYNIRPLELFARVRKGEVKKCPEESAIWYARRPFAPNLFMWSYGVVREYLGDIILGTANTFEEADAIVQAHYRKAVTNWLDANLLPPPHPNPPVATWD
jgi:hypothetical protein